jgi:hypothetical protein
MAAATTSTLQASPPRKRESGRSRRGHWNRRRAWLDKVLRCALLTANAVRVATLLASRSDDDAKAVWGTQVHMAEELGLSERTIRRCLLELEQLALIRVERRPAWCGPGGRFVYRPCNTYVLTVPTGASLAAAEAPRRVPKAGYCRLRPSTHLPDSNGRTTPLTGCVEPPALSGVDSSTGEIGQTAHDLEPEEFARRLAAVRAALVRPPVASTRAPA